MEASKEERLKGYKIKVQYQPVQDMEKKTKREAIGQVILQALRRIKDKNQRNREVSAGFSLKAGFRPFPNSQ